jgi:Flp pilus assembly protein TadD
MKNIEEREIALDKYARSHPQNSYYYFLKGFTARMAGKFKLARESYYHAIEKDPANTEAMNNLGMILMEQFNELSEAKKLFENAVTVQLDFTIARLNLGMILSKLGEKEKAKEQYEKIIEYDAAEPKAYNNLANYYRSFINDPVSLVKAEELLRKAIEIQPDYLEAYLNLGNLLKTAGRNQEGNQIYQKAKEMDQTGESHPIFDILIASKKG